MKTLEVTEPGGTRQFMVSDERAELLLTDPRFSLVEDNGPDETEAEQPVSQPAQPAVEPDQSAPAPYQSPEVAAAASVAQNEPEAGGGVGQPEQEE